MNPWTDILTKDQLEAYHASTAALDPAFAAKQHSFYKSRTLAQLLTHKHEAWLCNDSEGYMLASSYAKLLTL